MKFFPVLTLIILVSIFACTNNNRPVTNEITNLKLTKAKLKDKTKGGWAGQVIGCSFGGPTEFRYNGTMINDYQPIDWNENSCLWFYKNSPGLYDDVYMDLTFVDVFEKNGLDAPASLHAQAFANAGYKLWHANQAARYNILSGIFPPESGAWQNNPHADDIDFQIEADFAGLMAPGMVNSANGIADRVGHIMNYGDGWYGGVYVASMYALAFISTDIKYVVTEALKAIPAESDFYKCISDVILWHQKYPDDWQQTWFEVQRKWSSETGCPDGVFSAFNIDAKINAAYIVIGLLYGNGDFSSTLEISTRCGQDSDCNPASAGGILGTLLGYSNIPEYWRTPVLKVEDIDFEYTEMSLNDVYETGTRHAIQMLEKNGAKITGDSIEIPVQKIIPVKYEKSFEGHFPKSRIPIQKSMNRENPEVEVNFEGNGFVLTGGVINPEADNPEGIVLEVEIAIDENQPEVVKLPADFRTRRHEIVWRYNLKEQKHNVRLKLLNPKPGFSLKAENLISYSLVENKKAWKNAL